MQKSKRNTDYEIVYSLSAKADLEAVFRYIAFTFQDYRTAIEQYERIVRFIDRLRYFPYRFREVDSESLKSLHARIMPTGSYSVIYLVDEEKKTVYVLHIVHDLMDINHLHDVESV